MLNASNFIPAHIKSIQQITYSRQFSFLQPSQGFKPLTLL